MTSIVGPVNLTTHEETGLLIDGFSSPMVLAPWNPACHEELVIAAGYSPHRRYGAWEWTPAAVPSPAVRRIAHTLRGDRYRTVRFRPFDPSRFDEDVDRLCSLYNDAFRDVWGFVSISPREFRERATGFRPFYRPDLVLLAFVGDDAVGFALILPDINEALHALHGRLLPFGWFSLPGRIRRIRNGRFILMAVRPDQAGRGIAAALALRLGEAVRAAGFERIEVSLVQEDNHRMVRVVEGLGCVRTRTWALFRKAIQ
jgi:GNAT superfamily N-acetyltransferase